ncbi:hypothetical protein AMATHDRAFT_77826 [Amanita thiersii Skay4041]|uniref:BTB domain-containing protein n=1 Tax=Amanita thiersii Skay4041 TaxID=703135 RepID=A0A2A9NEK1_9AGAR|nr:hypothetical protein AMATHDRAFT_77826 [Amanita thiersii Skay4041]
MTQEHIKDSDQRSAESPTPQHRVFWFDDGSIVLQAQQQRFRVHYRFLSRLSPFFSSQRFGTISPDHVVELASEILATDFEALLMHLYHDRPLSPKMQIDHIASILRITSPRLLDFPAIHASAKELFIGMFPTGPTPNYHPAKITEALAVATEYNLSPVRKTLFYSIITTSEVDFYAVDDGGSSAEIESEPENSPMEGSTPSSKQKITPNDARCCAMLMEKLIEHFTPILFTPATTPHMACTDVFADTWMTLIVQPALEDEGVYKPVETLERFKSIDWAKQGLCESCVVEKREEWTAEQHVIWDKIDRWLA